MILSHAALGMKMDTTLERNYDENRFDGKMRYLLDPWEFIEEVTLDVIKKASLYTFHYTHE
jgi:hypothetical protein